MELQSMSQIMMYSKKDKLFCPICLEAQEKYDFTKDNIFKCSKCESSIDVEELNSLLLIIENVVKLGYLYPRIETKRQKTVKFNLVVPPELLWIGTVAIGGIIGNFSYDLIKLFFKRATEKNDKLEVHCLGKIDHETKKIEIGLQLVESLDLSEEEFKLMADGIRKYISNEKELNQIKKNNLTKRIGTQIKRNQHI